MRSYTVAVDTHKANIEIHATGCRDIKHLPAGTQTWEVIAPTAKQAIKDGELTGCKVNACCAHKRMDAAGRVAIVAGIATPAGETVAEGGTVPVDIVLQDAMNQLAQDATDRVIAELEEAGVDTAAGEPVAE